MGVTVYVDGEEKPRVFSGGSKEAKKILDDKFSQIRSLYTIKSDNPYQVISEADKILTDADNRKIFKTLALRANPIGAVRDALSNFMDYSPYPDKVTGSPGITAGDIAREAMSASPILGDLQSAAEAHEAFERGDISGVGMIALGLVTSLPSGASKIVEKAKDIVSRDVDIPEDRKVLLFHDTHEASPITVKDEGKFGGIFAGTEGGMYGPSRHEVVLDKEKILTHQMFDYDIDYDEAKKAIKKSTPWLDDADIDEIYPYISEDSSSDIFSLDEDELYKFFRETDPAEASWEAQRIRGQTAKNLGYDAVEMRDETGIATLVLPGLTTKPISTK